MNAEIHVPTNVQATAKPPPAAQSSEPLSYVTKEAETEGEKARAVEEDAAGPGRTKRGLKRYRDLPSTG